MSSGEMTIGAFLEALAAKQSTPGGGGAAAITGSQAAALLSMVIRFTLGNKRYVAVQDEMERLLEQSETLRRELLALADRDVEAFTGVAACYGMPRESDAEKAARTVALQEALKGATEVPSITASRCLAVLELAEPVGAQGNANVVSDAAAALFLAQAALRCAIVNVDINLKLIKDEVFVETMRAQRDQVLAEAGVAFDAARRACEQTLGVAL